jgi:hypothetical protein
MTSAAQYQFSIRDTINAIVIVSGDDPRELAGRRTAGKREESAGIFLLLH